MDKPDIKRIVVLSKDELWPDWKIKPFQKKPDRSCYGDLWVIVEIPETLYQEYLDLSERERVFRAKMEEYFEEGQIERGISIGSFIKVPHAEE